MRRGRKKYILKGAVVLLIVIAMVFSSVAIAANTKETSKIATDDFTVIKEGLQCNPDVDVRKDVWDPEYGGWVPANTEGTAADLPICENTQFRIRVWNTGDCPINGGVLDNMDDHLKFISSDPEPDDFLYEPPFYWMIWAFPENLNPGEMGPEIIVAAENTAWSEA